MLIIISRIEIDIWLQGYSCIFRQTHTDSQFFWLWNGETTLEVANLWAIPTPVVAHPCRVNAKASGGAWPNWKGEWRSSWRKRPRVLWDLPGTKPCRFFSRPWDCILGLRDCWLAPFVWSSIWCRIFLSLGSVRDSCGQEAEYIEGDEPPLVGCGCFCQWRIVTCTYLCTK